MFLIHAYAAPSHSIFMLSDFVLLSVKITTWVLNALLLQLVSVFCNSTFVVEVALVHQAKSHLN